jgi:magnesium transporter
MPPEFEPTNATTETESGETVVREHPTGVDTEAEQRLATLYDANASTAELVREAEAAEAPEAADFLETLERDDSVRLVHSMADEAAAEALAHMELPLAATILCDLPAPESASYLALMDPDDAVDLLQELEKPRADAILAELPPRRAAALGTLALYDPETAGGLMTTRVIRVPDDTTVTEAVRRIRASVEHDEEEFFYVFCVDDQGRLTGVVNLRALLLAQPETPIQEIMSRDLVVLRATMDQEAVAREFERYDHVALPVLDERDRLLGVVTIDDVIDTIRQEQTEDALKQVGAGPSEVVYDTVAKKLRSRSPWLVVNLGAALLAALVILQFEEAIAALPLLAVLMPVIANQAGNGGQQSLAVTLRGLVLGEVRRQRVGKLLLRETIFGFLTGVLVGAILAGGMAVLGALDLIDGDWKLGLVAGVSMAVSLALGCLMGTGIPLLMERLKFDPATASTVFLIMLTDMISFAAFLGLAAVLGSWLLPPAA